MALRSIGKIIRGKATPAQMMAACLIGALLGFVPGASRAPGLVAALVLALLVVNASLPLALLTWPLAELASWLLMPIAFHLGRLLIDGPLQGLFRALVNLPVIALFGLEHYAVTGGLVLGAIFGLAVGMLVTRTVARIRRAMAGVEAGSSAYQKIAGKWWANLLAWALVGGRRGKLSWADVAARKGGSPVRWWGAGIAALLVVAAVSLQSVLAGPLLGSVLRSRLAQLNGATVDLDEASIDLAEGRLVLAGLAFADPNALERDAFRASRLEADISARDLLRKRLRLDRVVISDASQGLTRSSPGERVGPEPKTPEREERGTAEGGPRSLEDYVRSAETWRERLRQARRVLDALAGDDAEAEAGGAPAGETPAERAAREAELMGYANAVASHLIEGSPTFAITELRADGVTSTALPGEVLDIRAEHLSTQPRLETGPPRLTITSRSGLLSLDVGLAAMSGHPGSNALRFDLNALPVDRFAGDLAVGGEPPLQGGTLDLSLDGTWSGGRVGYIDMPLNVVLHDTTLRLGGSAKAVPEFRLPLGLRGPIDDPAITIDDADLVASLKAAGAAELAARVDEKKAEVLGEAKGKLDEKLEEKVGDKLGDKAKDALGGLLGGKKKKD